MMKNNDYKNFDTLTLYVKRNKVEDIIEHYKVFGWELSEQSENAKYEDIVDLTFTRPHKIENKDEIQLRQVYMEEHLNELGKLERHKHAKTTAIGLCVGVLSLILLALGVWECISNYLTLGLVTIGLGLIILTLELIFLPKLYKREIRTYDKKKTELENQVDEICEKVKTLLGGEDGKSQ